LQTHQLVPHPNFAPAQVKRVSVQWSQLRGGRLMLRYRVDGCASLLVPEFHGRGRADELWKHTCFELFLYDGHGHYREFNFSPCQQWAAYAFNGYRSLSHNFEPKVAPEIKPELGEKIFMQTVFIDQAELDGVERVALAAVIEEQDRRPSYWALRHNGLSPDFHDPACFTLSLGSAGNP
jgi:hypothetical protein